MFERYRYGFLILTLVAVVFGLTVGVAEAEWPLDQKLRELKKLGFELVAIIDGKDVSVNTPEQFRGLPDDPPATFKLVEIETGKDIPIVMNKSESWGRALWEGLCDAAGLEPHCNGFFK